MSQPSEPDEPKRTPPDVPEGGPSGWLIAFWIVIGLFVLVGGACFVLLVSF